MSITPGRSDASSRESSPPTPEVYKMSHKQRMEKWKRVGEFGGVGLLNRARARQARLRAAAPRHTTPPSNTPEPQQTAQPAPAPAVSKQPIAPLSQRAPPKIVKPASRPAAKPLTRPATTLPASIEDRDIARAIGAFRSEERRKMPPKGFFTAPQPGLKRVMPIPARAFLQMPPQRYHNPLHHAYWPGMPAKNSSTPGWAARQVMLNPLQLPLEERVADMVRLHELYLERGEIGGLPRR